MKKVFLGLAVVLLLSSCATATRTNQLSLGMTKAQVIEAMGEPTSSHATNGVEYLTYKLTAGSSAGTNAGCAALGLITFGIAYATNPECTGGVPIDYYAQIKDGKLVGYGKVGDFGTTKNPTIDINKTIINK